MTERTEIQDHRDRDRWVLYDGDCPMCVRLAGRFAAILRRHGFALALLQSPWVRSRLGSVACEPLDWPAPSHQTIVNLIGRTTTQAGLTVRAEVDTNTYDTGIKVSDTELAQLKLVPHAFHGEWNYQLRPRE